jgi:hypothetical protein
MRRLLVPLLLLVLAAWAANTKLYLKDGSFHIVREYQVQGDRVRFYSVERSEWEEMPLSLVDLKRTESESAARSAEVAKESKIIAEEEKAERAVADEVSRIPQDPGVYWVEAGQTKILHAAESTLRTNKGRSILKRLAPIPVVTGKGTVEISPAHLPNIFTNPDQEFYMQLSQLESFGIIRVNPKGSVRVVENVTFMPVTNEVIEEVSEVLTFQRELAEGLYKIWPKEPLAPGEYAIVQYSQGKLNMQVWDFAIKASK